MVETMVKPKTGNCTVEPSRVRMLLAASARSVFPWSSRISSAIELVSEVSLPSKGKLFDVADVAEQGNERQSDKATVRGNDRLHAERRSPR